MCKLQATKQKYMKKLPLSFLFLSFIMLSFSQNKELTDLEKDELRKNHNSSFTFSKTKTSNNTSLSTSNTKEESDKDVVTKVKYYYGKEDSLYKEFEYIKRD